jgi:hypothetical protein
MQQKNKLSIASKEDITSKMENYVAQFHSKNIFPMLLVQYK